MHTAGQGGLMGKPCDMAEIRGYGSRGGMLISSEVSWSPLPSSPSDLACDDPLASH